MRLLNISFFLFFLLLFFILPVTIGGDILKMGKTEIKRAVPVPYIHPPEPRGRHGFHNELKITLERGFDDPALIDSLFNDPRFGIDSLILFPPKVIPKWKGYSFLFTDQSIKRGRGFLNKNLAELKKISSVFSVPPPVIVSILKVETDLGRLLGRYYVPNVFYTRYYINRKRGRPVSHLLKQFRSFLEVSREMKWDPLQIRGSWAGAFGLPQFMPYSYQHYAVDWDGDHRADLFEKDDAMASVGNYLFQNGWKGKNRSKQDKALWRYNNSRAYVRAVYQYALMISGNNKSHVF